MKVYKFPLFFDNTYKRKKIIPWIRLKKLKFDEFYRCKLLNKWNDQLIIVYCRRISIEYRLSASVPSIRICNGNRQ